MPRPLAQAAVGLIFCILIAACSNAAAPSASGPSASISASPSALNPSGPPSSVGLDLTTFLPAGTYTADIPAGLAAAPGTWKMRISPEGITWVNPDSGAEFSPGEIIDVTASTITFAPDPGCPDQSAGATNGIYDWRLENGALRFTLQSDSCAGRRDTLAPTPWVPAP